MSEIQSDNAFFPAVRACIFDVDGLLINSEDIYTEIYNNILRSYRRPDLPWSVKARQQSRGREGMLQLLQWAQLPITYDEWTSEVSAQYDLFKNCVPLPGVPELLSNLSSKTAPVVHIAIASSATSKTFKTKTSHMPSIASAFPQECRVFGDDPAMSEARKKPLPDVFLLALGRINAHLDTTEETEVRPKECLVFEDSVAGVEAGRRAGMRVCWVPHKGLREVWRGREMKVLEGKSEVDSKQDDTETILNGYQEHEQKHTQSKDRSHVWTEDGWAEMLTSLEGFDYDHYGIRLKEA